MSDAAERSAPYSIIKESFQAVLAAIMAPAGDPIDPPLPRINPKRDLATTPPTPGVIAQCGAATIVSKLSGDGETLVYRATFAPDMIDQMVERGCEQFYRGCNICSVRYDGCTDEEKNLCGTTACLERVCERKVRCSSKVCQARGKEPTCESRMARTECKRTFFQ